MTEPTTAESILKVLLIEGEIRYSEPATFKGLTIVPVLSGLETSAEPGYVLFEEALAAGAIVVEEAGNGTVPKLWVRNIGDRRVLLVDGEHLIGAKQDRILNTTILVPAKSTIEIPVSCVEAGRWRMSTLPMAVADAGLFPAARAGKAAAVTMSLRLSGTYASDQQGIWSDVAAKLRETHVPSPTSSMADVARHRRADLEEYVRALPWKEGQTGVVCGISGAVICVDVFDHPRTLQKLYPRLIRSYTMDALTSADGAISTDDARAFIESVARGTVTTHAAVGEGEELRLTGEGVIGSALVADQRVVHLALFKSVGPRERQSASPMAPPSRRSR